MDASWFSVPVVAETARRLTPKQWLLFSSSSGRLLPVCSRLGTMSLFVFVRSRRRRLRDDLEISDMNEVGEIDEEGERERFDCT